MSKRIIALCGGIGGAKLALGLSHVVPADDLAIIVNTGDDFEHLGLSISPDVDTVIYTLAGLANSELGWGLEGETWGFMDQLKRLGGETWFNLGDRDLAMHVERTRRLRKGDSLSNIVGDLARSLEVRCTVWPMSDDPVRTELVTDEGVLPFQDYFVRRRTEPAVHSITYKYAATARPNPLALAALADPGLEAVVICPSNPWLSVAPALAMPVLRKALAKTRAPVIAVSPIIGGRAIKGPTAKLMRELGLPVTAAEVAIHYAGLVRGFVLDEADRSLTEAVARQGMQVDILPTLMTDLASKQALARGVLDFAKQMREG